MSRKEKVFLKASSSAPSSLPCFTLPAVVGPQPGPSILPSIPKVGYLKVALMEHASFHALHINLRKSSLTMQAIQSIKMLASLKLPTRRCFLPPSVCSPLSFFHRSHRCQCVGSLAPPSVRPSDLRHSRPRFHRQAREYGLCFARFFPPGTQEGGRGKEEGLLLPASDRPGPPPGGVMRRAVSDVYLVFPVRFPHRSLPPPRGCQVASGGRRGGREASCHPPPRCSMRRGAVITGASSEFPPPDLCLPPSLPYMPLYLCLLFHLSFVCSAPLSLSGGVRIAL